ncbi:hypothetical protein F2P81_011832 [Scophthalmus maximus]|uniref:Uncharacterized protein n=1 Tax=Scophthalmus maximus TaxID=52904 RepID=A0A6A4SX95_SCOMX|nr:hypothetical protein F2P81_011832 [Scophthalmus maximus]
MFRWLFGACDASSRRQSSGGAVGCFPPQLQLNVNLSSNRDSVTLRRHPATERSVSTTTRMFHIERTTTHVVFRSSGPVRSGPVRLVARCGRLSEVTGAQ